MGAAMSSPRSERLDRARGLLDSAHRAADGRVWGRPRPEAVPAAAIRPVAPTLAGLMPHGGGLRRGSTVLVRSSASLLFALLAEASAQGTWCALVAVTSALLDGVELVVVAGPQRLRAGDRQRLAARARQRDAVLFPVKSAC
jgi:hypothetical protein